LKASWSKTKAGLWIGSVTFVLAVGIHYFPREYPSLGFWESLYSTLRLFVFERDLDPFPRAAPLVFIYFLAPLIALSAVGTAVSYLFRLSPVIKTRWMSDHVVICGVGRTGRLLAETLHESGVAVVGVDLGPTEEFEEWCAESRVPVVFGSFQSRAVLKRVGAARARSVIFASGDDLANLEGVVGAYAWLQRDAGAKCIIWAHIADERLVDTARSTLRTSGAIEIRFFDTYHIAAAKTVEGYFNRRARSGVREVNILGFGKFGRDLFEVLVKSMDDEDDFSIKVIDKRDRGPEVYKLAQQLGVTGSVDFGQLDIHHLELVDDASKAFFLCTDDDLGNLTVAMMLAGEGDATHIYVRMTHWPIAAVADHLGEDRGVAFININDLVRTGIQDLPGVFEPLEEA
jgi:voltage-gated potassium channel Kch